MGAVIGEGKTCQRPMPGIPGDAWFVGPCAYNSFCFITPSHMIPLKSRVDHVYILQCTLSHMIHVKSRVDHIYNCVHLLDVAMQGP